MVKKLFCKFMSGVLIISMISGVGTTTVCAKQTNSDLTVSDNSYGLK